MKSQRKVLITGCTRGLGRAMTEEFVRLGHEVAGCGTKQGELEQLRRAGHPGCRFDRVDVTSDSSVAAWAKVVLAEWGTPDLLLNNAATINANASLWEVPVDEFDRVIDVNIKGVANVLRHFLPSMITAKEGVIVNFSSGWGRSTDANVAPYCATKWATEGLTQSLAQELPRGMAAIPLNPGIINTEMLQSCFGGGASSFPTAAQWAKRSVPFLLKLGPEQNGEPATVPG